MIEKKIEYTPHAIGIKNACSGISSIVIPCCNSCLYPPNFKCNTFSKTMPLQYLLPYSMSRVKGQKHRTEYFVVCIQHSSEARRTIPLVHNY